MEHIQMYVNVLYSKTNMEEDNRYYIISAMLNLIAVLSSAK